MSEMSWRGSGWLGGGEAGGGGCAWLICFRIVRANLGRFLSRIERGARAVGKDLVENAFEKEMGRKGKERKIVKEIAKYLLTVRKYFHAHHAGRSIDKELFPRSGQECNDHFYACFP